MPLIQDSVEIAAPLQTVWDLLADPRNHSQLGTFVAEVTVLGQGEVGEGTVYRERSGPGPMKSASEWTITRFDPPRNLVHVSDENAMKAEATWMLEDTDSGSTTVTQSLDFEMMPRFRPLGWLLEQTFAQRMTQRETRRMLQDLKRIAESTG